MNALPCSAAADRNKQAILDRLCELLPAQGNALEIASGTGQHVVCFATGLPQWTWQPTDYQASALPAIAARITLQRVANVSAPLQLDVMAPKWFGDAQPLPNFDLIFCANMLHISPWATCAGLMQGGARHLAHGGALIVSAPRTPDL